MLARDESITEGGSRGRCGATTAAENPQLFNRAFQPRLKRRSFTVIDVSSAQKERRIRNLRRCVVGLAISRGIGGEAADLPIPRRFLVSVVRLSRFRGQEKGTRRKLTSAVVTRAISRRLFTGSQSRRKCRSCARLCSRSARVLVYV